MIGPEATGARATERARGLRSRLEGHGNRRAADYIVK